MNKALAFVRLDFLTVKPYLTTKNLLIFAAIALFMTITNGNAMGAVAMLMTFAAMYISYPFAIGEKSNIDMLYATLSIKREMVVLGRYLFALTLDLLVGCFAFAFAVAALTIMRKHFDVADYSRTIPVFIAVIAVVQAVQLPIYFKVGYTKAKFLVYLPFVVLPLVIVAFSNAFKDAFSVDVVNGVVAWFSANMGVAVLGGVVLWVLVVAGSYRVSVWGYGKREF